MFKSEKRIGSDSNMSFKSSINVRIFDMIWNEIDKKYKKKEKKTIKDIIKSNHQSNKDKIKAKNKREIEGTGKCRKKTRKLGKREER